MSENFADLGVTQDTTSAPEKVTTQQSYGPIETGIYDATIDIAWLRKAQNSQSKAMVVTLKIDGGNILITDTVWVSNQQGETHYTDENSGAKIQLPNFTLINDLANMLASKNISALDMPMKEIDLWDNDARKRVATPKPVAVELLNKPVKVALRNELQDINKEVSPGKWKPSGEFREVMKIEKFFDPTTNKTAAELREGKNANYFAEFTQKSAGKQFDKRSAEGKSKAKQAEDNASASTQSSAASPTTF